ncbi:hypothetical protein IGI04_036237 [Brassica rapa subsp. trilocularis]|uniref:Ubiquitin-like protease family profile domain-containing protein n=1 Tax=Brassica rapa subsp. trilocularis TaxID=1813537 RepID=A0ABQ7LDW9_BRACM|nr:hypothetical protein IGI04_036237 [Brassica rapa subsp. trilocularis]
MIFFGLGFANICWSIDLGRLTSKSSDVQYSTDDLLVSRLNRTEPLILQCTFKPNRIIYRPYISFFLFIFSRNSKTLTPFLSKTISKAIINRSHRRLSLRRYHRRSHHRKKMDIPKLPRRIHTVGEEPPAGHSISESVNGTNAGRKRLPEDKGPDVPADDSSSKDKAPEPSLVLLDKNHFTVSDLQKEDARYQDKRDAALALCRAKSDRTRRLAASQQSHYAANRTAKVIIPNKKLYPGYNPFAPIDKKKLKELADWLKTCPHYRAAQDKKPHDLPISRLHIDAWINVLRKRYHANPQHFRSERMCFVDHLFAQQWRFNFKDFKDSEPDQNGLRRRLPGGAWNYYACTIPSFFQSNKVWETDIDDIYAPVNYNNNHWIAMWISIPKRHIVVFDSICSSISPEELDVVMEPFVYMVPYLLVECASSDEQRAQYSLEPFTFERPDNISQARAGDCGMYTLKYIECHALGIEFTKKDFAKANGKTMRDKMVVDIFQELPDAHEFLNKDNDANLGAYEA